MNTKYDACMGVDILDFKVVTKNYTINLRVEVGE